MSTFTSELDRPVSECNGFLRLPKVFIMRYLPTAPAIYLKVLIVAWEACYGQKTTSWLGYRKIAERAGVCESTVKNAMRYWQNKGVIKVVHRYLRDANDFLDFRSERSAEYSIQTSNLIVFRLTAQATKPDITPASADGGGLPTQPQGGYTDTLGSGLPAQPQIRQAPLNHTIEEDKQTDVTSLSVEPNQVENHQPETNTDSMIAITLLANVTKRKLEDISKPERNHLKYLLAHYPLSDVLDALRETGAYNRNEKPVQSFLRFATKILKNWLANGKRMSDKAAAAPTTRYLRNPEQAAYYAKFAKLEEKWFDIQALA